MAIVHRLKNHLHTKASNTLDKTHLSLYHNHTAAIFEKGHTSILAYGRNHKSCILRQSDERKRKNFERRKGRREQERMSYRSCRTELYRQLPIKGWKNDWKFKTLYTGNSGPQKYRRTKTIETVF